MSEPGIDPDFTQPECRCDLGALVLALAACQQLEPRGKRRWQRKPVPRCEVSAGATAAAANTITSSNSATR